MERLKVDTDKALLSLLLVKQQRMSEVQGIERMTPQIATLLTIYHRDQMQIMDRVVRATFLKGLLDHNQDKVHKMVLEARSASVPRRRELLRYAVRLEQQSVEYFTLLEALNV
jgi:hypothetical protein